MMHSWKHYPAYTVLAVALAGSSAAAQATEGENATNELNRLKIEALRAGFGADGQDARSTQRELAEILRTWYPPTLNAVLQLDPSLLENSTYMMSYPRLATFIEQHPEVKHNPAYFLGTPYEQQRGNTLGRALAPVITTVIALGLMGMVTWIIRATVDHRRWLRLSKLQTEAHSKLMDRFSSNDDFLAFIQSPAGKRFLESSAIPIEPRSIGAPVGRILWSVQIGLVLFSAGMGLGFVSTRTVDEAAQAFFVFGVLVLAVGTGFILSGLTSYVLSRRFGLFDPAITDSLPSGRTILSPPSSS